MTRAERPDDAPVRQPKPSWGPGKNAALSIVAFAAIFGAFAYVERDVGMGNAAHTTVTRDIAGVVGTAVQKSRDAIVAVTDNASGPSASAGAASTVAQAAPGKSSAAEAEAAPVMSAAAGPTVAPPIAGRSHPKPTRHAQKSTTTLTATQTAPTP